jgi:Flp pilus assembly pilin Flp
MAKAEAHMRRVITRLLADDSGQDLIEYALLTGIIAIAGAAVIPLIRDNMAAAYAAWNNDVQAIWEPPPPTP